MDQETTSWSGGVDQKVSQTCNTLRSDLKPFIKNGQKTTQLQLYTEESINKITEQRNEGIRGHGDGAGESFSS